MKIVKKRVFSWNLILFDYIWKYCKFVYFSQAQLILKFVDRTIDPCDNFYQFSCGKFLKSGTEEDEFFSISTKRIQKRMNVIRNMDENLFELIALKKMHFFIQRCLHHGKLQKCLISLIFYVT